VLLNLCASVRDLMAGDKEERELLLSIASSLDIPFVNLQLQPVHVAVWKDRGTTLEVEGREYQGLALPYSSGGTAEGRVVDSLDEVEGEVLASEWPRDPDDAKFLVIEALERGASAVVFCGKSRRIAISSDPYYRDDYSLVRIPVISVDLPKEELVGRRVKLFSDVHIGRGLGYNLVALFGSPSYVLLSAHHDHWLYGALDDCSGLDVAVRAFVKAVEELVGESPRHGLALALFTAEECCGVNFPSFYWAWGSREFIRWVKDVDLIHAVLNIDVVGRGVERAYSANPLRYLLQDLFPLDPPSAYFDSVSFDSVGVPAATLSSMQDNMDVYHSPDDKVDVVVPQKLEDLSNKVARTAARIALEGLDVGRSARWLEERLRKHGVVAKIENWSSFRLAYSLLHKYVVEYRGGEVEVKHVDILEYLSNIVGNAPDVVQVLGGPVIINRSSPRDVGLLRDYLRDQIQQELR